MIIPARGGSKRIPKKNIHPLNGKPMIAWTINHFVSMGFQTFVNTDDQEIAEISEQYGALVPFLRQHYADDHSPVSAATSYFLEQLVDSGILQNSQSNIIQAMANCPIRDQNMTLNIINEYEQGNGNLISGASYKWLNPFWAHSYDGNETWKPLFSDFHGVRSQDLPHALCPTGSTWIARIDELIQSRNFYAKKYKLFDLGFFSSVDIDEYDDLHIAEKLLKLKSWEDKNV